MEYRGHLHGSFMHFKLIRNTTGTQVLCEVQYQLTTMYHSNNAMAIAIIYSWL